MIQEQGFFDKNGQGYLLYNLFVKAVWAIGAHGAFSTSNFILGILLARWLPEKDYGVYVVSMTLFWFLLALYSALMIEPMLVFGAGKYREGFQNYFRTIISYHWRIGLIFTSLFVIISGGALIFGARDSAWAIFGLAISGPFIFLEQLCRRACYSQLQPKLASFAGIIYLITLLTIVFLEKSSNLLSVFFVFLSIGFAATVAAIWMCRKLNLAPFVFSFTNEEFAWRLANEHWTFGKWAMGANLLQQVPSRVYYLGLPFFWGIGASAALRAIMGLILPILQLITALSSILIPSFVRTKGSRNFVKIFYITLILVVVAALMYWILLINFSDRLINWMYEGKYIEYSYLLQYLGLLPLLNGISMVLGALLRSTERPNLIFWATLLSAGFSLTVGMWLMVIKGISGAGLSLLFAFVINSFALGWLVYWRKRDLAIESPRISI